MAQGKKSFVAYADWKNVFDELPNEDAGALIKHIFAYVNDEEPQTESVLIRAVFANIKSTLKRDLNKWENQLEQRSKAGKASAEARKNKVNEDSTVVEIRERNPTVNDNVNVTVNDNVIHTPLTPKGELSEKDLKFLKWYNEQVEKKTGKFGQFKALSKTDRNNLKSLNKSYIHVHDWVNVFNAMWESQWCVETNNRTPTHMLRVDNFNKYMAIKSIPPTQISISSREVNDPNRD